jgi:hypothetical protein
MSDSALAATTCSQQRSLLKEVKEILFKDEQLLLLAEDELGYTQPHGAGTRTLYAVYAAALPELTVTPGVQQMVQYLGAKGKSSTTSAHPLPTTTTTTTTTPTTVTTTVTTPTALVGKRDPASPASAVLLASKDVLVQPCEVGDFIAKLMQGSPRNVALLTTTTTTDVDSQRGKYMFPGDQDLGQSYSVHFATPEWIKLSSYGLLALVAAVVAMCAGVGWVCIAGVLYEITQFLVRAGGPTLLTCAVPPTPTTPNHPTRTPTHRSCRHYQNQSL